jgi:hypothetical protein
MRCDAIAIRNAQTAIYFLLSLDNPLIIPCFKVPSSVHGRRQGGAPTVEKLGDRPWLMGEGFAAFAPLPSLCYCSLALEHPSVHVPIFSDICHVIRSVVDRRRPDMLVPGARALTAQEYVTFDRRKNEQKPPVRAVG